MKDKELLDNMSIEQKMAVVNLCTGYEEVRDNIAEYIEIGFMHSKNPDKFLMDIIHECVTYDNVPLGEIIGMVGRWPWNTSNIIGDEE